MELGRLILHEAHDEDRLASLRARIEVEGEQRNPVIVSSQGDCCLVLDGAHRVRALEELGCRLTLAQFVEPPERAESWAHLLDGVALDKLHGVEEIEVSERQRGARLAEVELADGKRVFLRSREEGLLAEVRALWALQSLYPEGVVRRVEPNGRPTLTEGEAVVRYRSFAPGELVELVRSGAVLPAGITRFRVKERVLGVRYPLEKMQDGEASTRNAELRAFVERLWEENRIRYYEEPIVLFE
ncbi:MAG: ParB N-terminal domain-containing protein [Actinomycetota bacterium]|nr:ParB N-terminal domain-containing protein [Actinomycetota bacterium]